MLPDVMEQRTAQARYARERYDLYRARRELERACEHAQARLRQARARG